MDWQYPDPYLYRLTVTADNIDLLNHANNTAYIEWCQSAAWSHSESLGIPVSEYPEIDRAMAVVEAHYHYKAPALIQDVLIVGTWLTFSDHRMRMTRVFEIKRERDGQTLLSGEWKLVCIRVSDGKPIRMPTRFKACYDPAVIMPDDVQPPRD